MASGNNAVEVKYLTLHGSCKSNKCKFDHSQEGMLRVKTKLCNSRGCDRGRMCAFLHPHDVTPMRLQKIRDAAYANDKARDPWKVNIHNGRVDLENCDDKQANCQRTTPTTPVDGHCVLPKCFWQREYDGESWKGPDADSLKLDSRKEPDVDSWKPDSWKPDSWKEHDADSRHKSDVARRVQYGWYELK